MPQKNLIKMQCSVCKRINYWKAKNKKTIQRKIELAKYCKWCREHTKHVETKK